MNSSFIEAYTEAAFLKIYVSINRTFDATVGTDQGIKVANYTLDVARKDGAE